MRSQLSEDEIWSGMRPSGALPSLRTVSRARTAIWWAAGCRWTSISKLVISHSLAFGVFGCWRGDHLRRLDRVCLSCGLAVLVSRAGEDDLAAGRTGGSGVGCWLGLGRCGLLLDGSGRTGGLGWNRGDTETDEEYWTDGAERVPELHEPRPFCFAGLDATAALGRACGGGAALAKGFVKNDGAGCGRH